jgi:cytochrome c2
MRLRRHGTLLVALVLIGGCERAGVPDHLRIADGDPQLGRTLIAGYGCNACHEIPGIGQPSGRVGPSLAGFSRRAYVAGLLPNRPMLLTSWLRDPTAVDPETAMPAQGVSEPEARHMAAYLYTLR